MRVLDGARAVRGEAWTFAQVDDFWERYQTLTPWGKDAREAREVLVDRAGIESRYDDIDTALRWLGDRSGGSGGTPSGTPPADSSAVDRVSYHLKRMPRLPLEARDGYEVLELFQVKKFLANYRGLVSSLGDEVAARFGLTALSLDPAARGLAAELDRGGSDPETFHLADCYDEALAVARAGIAAADRAIGTERARAEAEARLSFGVSFDGREFVVAPSATARAMVASCGDAGSGARYMVEPYDDSRFIVRLLPSPEAVDAMAERERRLEDERAAEDRVTARLSALVRDAMPWLSKAVAAVARWDRARAGAVLAIELDMSRPELDSDDTVLDDAVFVPCADECGRLGLDYSPLTARFGKDAVVLFGSNMGGKTVVLKTILFFQLVAQAGLFVPARRFATRVYDRIEYVGELGGERHAGLSGFGLEIWRLDRARSAGGSPHGGALVAFDELARTTGSHEAEALLSAVVEAYSAESAGTRAAVTRAAVTRDRAFFATHFRGVARLPGAEYRRMRGLDRDAARDALRETLRTAPAGGERPLHERLAGINMYMRYEVVDDDGTGTESDALAIASFLGLDPDIVERARQYLEKDGP